MIESIETTPGLTKALAEISLFFGHSAPERDGVVSRWDPSIGVPVCPLDPDHGPMRWTGHGWRCRSATWNLSGCRGFRSLCSLPGHGEIIFRSRDGLGDYYCLECRAIHERVYLRPTPGLRIVRVEAEQRGGTCEFVFGGRCARRFEDGGLQWHHRDPIRKIATIAALARGGSLDVLVAELAKCELLCRPHHIARQRECE